MNKTLLFALAVSTSWLGGCLGERGYVNTKYPELRQRASFDLRCPSPDAAQIVEIDDTTRGVRCGDQQATYIWSYAQSVWVMNNDGRTGEKQSAQR